MKLRILLITLSCFLYGAVSAKGTFEVKAPNVVGSSERFRVEFVLNNAQGDSFVGPTFTGLTVLAGPSISNGTYITMNGSRQSTTTTQTYTYVLEPEDGVSRASISSASVNVGGSLMRTSQVSMEVVRDGRGSSSSASSGSSSGSSASGGASQGLASDDILLRMNVSKNKVYKGQALVATLKVYTRVGIAGLQEPKYPSFNGFWAQELEVPRDEPKRETMGGKLYDSQVIRMWLLFPQRSGLLTIEQTDFTALAQVVTRQSSGNSLFDDIFGGGASVQTVNRKISAPSQRITVEELPMPEPEGFTGAVGQFGLSSRISGTEFGANSAATMWLKISGSGNFPLLETPQVVMPDSFEQYSSKNSEQIDYSTSGAKGYIEYEYPFIARAEGKYSIEPVKFVYFDPLSKNYKTLSSDGYELKVGRDVTGGASPLIAGGSKEDIKMLGQDIRFIKLGNGGFYPTNRGGFMFSFGFWGIMLAEILLFASGMYLLRRRIAQRQDVARTKNRRANKMALKRLAIAKGFMANEDTSKQFYDEVLRGLWGYLSDKLLISGAVLTKELVTEKLTAQGADPTKIDALIALIEDCEMAQYSTQSSVPMTDVYKRALNVIESLEK